MRFLALKSLFLVFALFGSLLTQSASADLVSTFFKYETNSTLTNINLNGNFDAIRNVMNGSIDTVNIKEAFRLLEILGSLPVAGNEGRLVYNSTDDTLYIDDGTNFNSTVTPSGTPAQGDIPYRSATGWALLNAGTAGEALITNGTGANPSFGRITNIGISQTADFGGFSGDWSFNEIALVEDTAPSTAASEVKLYSKDQAGTNELFLRKESNGSELQITNGTYLAASNSTVFVSNGTFTVPNGISIVYLTGVGGGSGGQGGDSSNNGGGGGGGGAAVWGVPYDVTGAGGSVSVTVAGGGAGGSAGGSNGSEAGGNTTFGNLTIPGGDAIAAGSNGAGGVGGNISDSSTLNGTGVGNSGGGDTTEFWLNSGINYIDGGTGHSVGEAVSTSGGNAGGSALGGHGGAGGTAVGTVGSNGSGFGAGGGGGGRDASGGIGQAGILIVMW